MAFAWLARDFILSVPATMAAILGILSSFLFLTVLLPVVELLRSNQLRRAWKLRLGKQEELAQKPQWRIFLDSLVQDLNRQLIPLFQKGAVNWLLGLWQESQMGKEPLSLIAALSAVLAAGFTLGQVTLETALLKVFIIFLLLIGFLTLIYSRAQVKRRQFQDQFPTVLERLADSLQAGFSLPQAIEFLVPNLSQPTAGEMARIADQIQLGFSVDQALQDLHRRRPSQDIHFLVEGLTLQRQVGGDMATMMREMAELVRNRVELKNEVKTRTAQGKLSAVVITLLVPVSLGLLSLFPGYTDVLYKTTTGNLVLMISGVLELLGAVLVARLIRIEV